MSSSKTFRCSVLHRVGTAAAMAVAGYLMAPAAARSDDGVREGLPATDWLSIRAAYEANRHAAFADDGGFVARNPGQRWQTRFDGRGFITTPDSCGWSWGLDLVSYGRCDAHQVVLSPRCIDANGGYVEYEWDDVLTEWYVNDGRGLEHGYAVQQRLQGAGFLQLTVSVRGELRPKICADGHDVTFVNGGDAAIVHYTGLTVFDANGVELPAWFEIAETPHALGLRFQAYQIIVDDSNAVYPLTIDPIAQQAYLKASNTGAGDTFGVSVAASGDTVVVGAQAEDSNATGVDGNQADNSAVTSGAAYVFVRSGGVWSQQAYLKASNTGSGDAFGCSVAVSGDTVVVGALQEASSATGVNGNQTNNNAPGAGAAYVFIRIGGIWSQQAYLKASNTEGADHFGSSVAVSGNTVVVGAVGEDSNATGVDGNQVDNSATVAGAAYVFARSGTSWTQQAYLKASNTESQDEFGSSVAVSGDTIVIGAPGEASNATGVNGNQADNSAGSSGAAYVFVSSVGLWSQQAYLKASNTGAGDSFGSSVAISDGTIVVGAPVESSNATGVNGNQADNSIPSSGAAYVFVRSGAAWSQQAYLKASNTGANDSFGQSVAVSDDVVAVGAYFEDSGALGVNGNGADNSAGNSGAVYQFARAGSDWSQQAYLKALNTGANDQFGLSVAVSGDTVVVGAPNEDSSATGVNGNQADNAAGQSGAVYVFTGVGCPTLGNMNCDCSVDFADVDPFVQALLDAPGYALSYPTCNILHGDMQPNGSVDGGDVQGFVDLLTP